MQSGARTPAGSLPAVAVHDPSNSPKTITNTTPRNPPGRNTSKTRYNNTPSPPTTTHYIEQDREETTHPEQPRYDTHTTHVSISVLPTRTDHHVSIQSHRDLTDQDPHEYTPSTEDSNVWDGRVKHTPPDSPLPKTTPHRDTSRYQPPLPRNTPPTGTPHPQSIDRRQIPNTVQQIHIVIYPR